MLRDKNLIPLSHQHQHALALCVRIDRGLQAGDTDVRKWEGEITNLFENEIRFHFEAEEKVLFPAAAGIAGLQDLVDELLVEHGALRMSAKRAAEGQMTPGDVQVFAASLSQHVRKEERLLFEGLQKALSGDDLASLGAKLDAYFGDSGMPGASCEIRR